MQRLLCSEATLCGGYFVWRLLCAKANLCGGFFMRMLLYAEANIFRCYYTAAIFLKAELYQGLN